MKRIALSGDGAAAGGGGRAAAAAAWSLAETANFLEFKVKPIVHHVRPGDLLYIYKQQLQDMINTCRAPHAGYRELWTLYAEELKGLSDLLRDIHANNHGYDIGVNGLGHKRIMRLPTGFGDMMARCIQACRDEAERAQPMRF